jgi:hypothetical protein
MRIAFVWNFERAKEIYDYWRDGLRAAIEVIGETNDVDVWLGEDYKSINEDYDAYILWGDSNERTIDFFVDKKGKKTLILTTMPQDIENLRKYDVIFCESTPVYEEVRKHGLRAIKAFGTDTDFFVPNDREKDVEYFYPATFSPWKLQRNIAHLGDKLYCIGTVQLDGQEDLMACKDKGVHVAKGYFKVDHIRDMYQRARNVPIPAIHGSERTVLEAMASGIKPEVNQENIKAYSYIRELEASGLTPRDFVVKNYSHRKYAENIMKGINDK